jgi:serine/threonine-protein kinase RsbW
MERTFSRDIGSLDSITRFVAEFFEVAGVSAVNDLHVNLVIEELFTNSVKYAPDGAEIVIGLSREIDQLVITLRDQGVGAFDITRAARVDTTLPPEKRQRGGLGIHLVRTIARKLSYEHVGGDGITTVRMTLEG